MAKDSEEVQVRLPYEAILKLAPNYRPNVLEGEIVEVIPEKPRVLLLNPVFGKHDGGWVASGQVFGHPNFPNGEWVTTSRIERAVTTQNFIETRNSVYVLAYRVSVADVLANSEYKGAYSD